MPTPTRILQVAPVCGYLSSIQVAKGKGFTGEFLDPRTPYWIFYIYKVLNTIYEEDSNYDDITPVSNYLYALCSPWYFEAEAIVDGGGGGSVPSVTPGNPPPNSLDFIVAASGTPMVVGESSVTLTDFIGYEIDFYRGGITQYTTPQPGNGSYYAWNKFTGLFSIYDVASLGESFRISPRLGGTITSSSLNEPDTIILATDGTYTLSANNQIWRIDIYPSVADEVYIGTVAGGYDIMYPKTMTIDTFAGNGVINSVYAVDADVTIYFTGFTGPATIKIYTLPI